MNFSAPFPRRLFRWLFFKQILVTSALLLLVDGLIYLWLLHQNFNQESFLMGRKIVLVTLGASAVTVVAISLWMAGRLIFPLGRLLAKIQRIQRFPLEEGTEEELFGSDEPGEWYEFERALGELSRDLQIKTIRLSREKTELRTIMAAINEAVLAIDQHFNILFYNSQFALLFQPKSESGDLEDEVLKQSLSEVLRAPDILFAYESSLKKGIHCRVNVQLQMSDRLEKNFQVSVAPLKKKHNQEIYGAVAVFHDVTEMKKAEQMRVEFVGNVSHELKTPLTSIKGYLQTVQADLSKFTQCSQPIPVQNGNEIKSFLNIIDRNVERLAHLVDDLLDLSILQSGAKLNKKNMDLKSLTEIVLNQVDGRFHTVKKKFEIEQLYGDESRVEQVLRNLLQNAVRYVPQGGIIEISWTLGQFNVELHVKDDGPGIPLQSQAFLFERFYRVDEARSRQVGGSGIGLSLVKQIMQSHGGEVEVKSEFGAGAEFICRFPLSRKNRTQKELLF